MGKIIMMIKQNFWALLAFASLLTIASARPKKHKMSYKFPKGTTLKDAKKALGKAKAALKFEEEYLNNARDKDQVSENIQNLTTIVEDLDQCYSDRREDAVAAYVDDS